jgi:hypothetical protein
MGLGTSGSVLSNCSRKAESKLPPIFRCKASCVIPLPAATQSICGRSNDPLIGICHHIDAQTVVLISVSRKFRNTCQTLLEMSF